jgi:hypothetical protein
MFSYLYFSPIMSLLVGKGRRLDEILLPSCCLYLWLTTLKLVHCDAIFFTFIRTNVFSYQKLLNHIYTLARYKALTLVWPLDLIILGATYSYVLQNLILPMDQNNILRTSDTKATTN